MSQKAWIAFWSTLLLSGCVWDDSKIYTLYRSSVVDPIMRVHVATFDSSELPPYNQENCQHAVDLFLNQPGVSVRYWCEQGRYRP